MEIEIGMEVLGKPVEFVIDGWALMMGIVIGYVVGLLSGLLMERRRAVMELRIRGGEE